MRRGATASSARPPGPRSVLPAVGSSLLALSLALLAVPTAPLPSMGAPGDPDPTTAAGESATGTDETSASVETSASPLAATDTGIALAAAPEPTTAADITTTAPATTTGTSSGRTSSTGSTRTTNRGPLPWVRPTRSTTSSTTATKANTTKASTTRTTTTSRTTGTTTPTGTTSTDATPWSRTTPGRTTWDSSVPGTGPTTSRSIRTTAVRADTFTTSAATVGPMPSPCTIDDPRLSALRGLAPAGQVWYALGGLTPTLFEIDPVTCDVADQAELDLGPGVGQLAGTTDGRLWLVDAGDEENSGPDLALLRVTPSSWNVTRYELAYPDGPHDTLALLVGSGDQVMVVADGGANRLRSTFLGIGAAASAPELVPDTPGRVTAYVTGQPLTPGGTTVLSLVRTFTLPVPTVAVNEPAPDPTVTGGAVSPQGTRFALRTATHVAEWDAPDTDLGAALLQENPRLFRLPASGPGPAISYAANGTVLVTGSGTGPVPLQLMALGGVPEADGVRHPWYVWVPALLVGLVAALVAGAALTRQLKGQRGPTPVPVRIPTTPEPSDGDRDR